MEINIKTPEQKEFEEIAKALVAIYAKLDPDARHEVFSYAAYKYAQKEAEKESVIVQSQQDKKQS